MPPADGPGTPKAAAGARPGLITIAASAGGIHAIRFVRSSANPLFESAARVFDGHVIAVVLTGGGQVRVTLGPRSRCVLIEKKWGKPIVGNDGVTIAKEFA